MWSTGSGRARAGADHPPEGVDLLRHFSQLFTGVRREFFHLVPEEFDRHSGNDVLAHALGATLYVPGTRGDLADVVNRRVAAVRLGATDRSGLYGICRDRDLTI